MKKKNLFVTFLIKIAVILVFSVFCIYNIFEKLDYRLYDALFHLRKEPVKNEKILLLNIDDPSILALGEWPWTRDIIADALLRMRELGADTAIFDIEYISPSRKGISPSAEEKITDNLYATNDSINNLVQQFSTAISNDYYTKQELPALTEQLINQEINPSFDSLDEYIINNMARDNDEYFGQALQFFGKSYLTINHEDLGYPYTDEEIDYVLNRFMLNTVDDPSGLVEIGNERTLRESEEKAGLSPAMHKFISRAFGANFTNSVVDSDGVRRRMELMHLYQAKYDMQLAFGPFLEIVKSHDVIRKGDWVIIKNAVNPLTKNTEDIKIPVDEFGRILINWRKGDSDESFNHESMINLIKLDWGEEVIVSCLKNIYNQAIYLDDGFAMSYVGEAEELIKKYHEISDFKEYLLSKCTGYDKNNKAIDGISDYEYKSYFDLRNDFYSSVEKFINQNHLPLIIARLDQLYKLYGDQETLAYKEYLTQDFNDLAEQYNTYVDNFTTMQKTFDGAYCLIGTTAVSTFDTGATPFKKKYMNVGIHANILNTLINQDFIVNIRWYIGFSLAVALSLLMLLFAKLSNTKQNIISVLAYLIFCLVFAYLFVFSKYYIKFIGTILFLAADYVACVVYRFYQSVMEKKFITQLAASFANKDTVEELRRNPDAFKTEGQKKCITALFSDIQKFSTLSELISKKYGDEGPNKLIQILNDYLGQMSNEILKNNGNIDKYEGDAIISMFGAPDPMNSHTKEEWAYRCLDSAINMKKIEMEFNQLHQDLFVPTQIINKEGKTEVIQLSPLQTRIGINSGEAFVGLMGSKTESFSKLNYTMIGDTVNLASRLEGVNKAYNSWIMCSDATWNLANTGVHKGEIAVRKLDRVRVVGRSTPVQLYNVIGFTSELTGFQKQQLEIFDAALYKYLERDFAEAGKLFLQANSIGKGDPTSLVFAERCKHFIEKGIPKDWDGIINLTSK